MGSGRACWWRTTATTGGYFNGQCLVFLVWVTPKRTVPVGFRFHEPDPERSAWRREDRRLKRAGVRKADRPAVPAPNPAYPGKAEQALDLIGAFRRHHPGIRVKAVVADAGFGTQGFLDGASRLCGHVQAVSQLRNNQNDRFRGRDWSLTGYFRAYPGVPQRVPVRGGKAVEVVGGARRHVNAHARKRFVIALKYPGEAKYRFLVAMDLSWRTLDIVAAGNVAERLAELADKVKTWFPRAPSGKHMSSRDLGRQVPTPSLRYRAARAAATG